MKKILLLIMAVIQLTTVYSQKINYEQSFEEAKAKASRQNKPIFLLFTTPPIPVRPGANYYSAIDSKEVVDFYNENFVCYEVTFADTASNTIRKIINPHFYPAYVFLDSKAQPVYKGSLNSMDPQKYLDMARETLTRILGGRTLSYYQDLDKKGTINVDQLKGYIRLREEMELYNNATLIDKYVGFLSVQAFNDYYEVLFILQAGPNYGSNAYRLCFTNPKMVDSIYKNQPQQVRSDLNTRIITNTLEEAISTKNLGMAQNLSRFVSAIYGKSYHEAYDRNMQNMLLYYKSTKDTANYYRQGMNYYDGYFNISADSAKKLDASALQKMRAVVFSQSAGGKFQTSAPQGNIVVTNQASGTGGPNTVAATLGIGASDFYLMGTHNVIYLSKALAWCRKAVEQQPLYHNYDTMAHIMYRLNLYDEAQLNEQKAIDMAIAFPASKQQIDKLKVELDQMKERKL